MVYFRYRDRGGTQSFGDHLDDFRYISPNHHNMFPGSLYRLYFHANMSRTYNSLGDATAIFNRKLQAQHHPARPPSNSSHTYRANPTTSVTTSFATNRRQHITSQRCPHPDPPSRRHHRF
jgi:hypothetical protein